MDANIGLSTVKSLIYSLTAPADLFRVLVKLTPSRQYPFSQYSRKGEK